MALVLVYSAETESFALQSDLGCAFAGHLQTQCCFAQAAEPTAVQEHEHPHSSCFQTCPLDPTIMLDHAGANSWSTDLKQRDKFSIRHRRSTF